MAAKEHARTLRQPLEQSTNSFSAIFAFYYLIEEVLLRAMSSLSGSIHWIDWTFIFTLYFLIALISTLGMMFGVRPLTKLPSTQTPSVSTAAEEEVAVSSEVVVVESWLYRSTAAAQLLVRDSKMKYLIGLNAVFGFSAAFLGSFVNGEATQVVFGNQSNMVGILTAWLSIVAAAMSIVFAHVAKAHGKGVVLVTGSICFAWVALPFLLQPDLHRWSRFWMFFVYAMQGTGRATFEGTLKALFADFFPDEKEGAFAGIVIQVDYGNASSPARLCSIAHDAAP